MALHHPTLGHASVDTMATVERIGREVDVVSHRSGVSFDGML
jgi:hypothetical protein